MNIKFSQGESLLIQPVTMQKSTYHGCFEILVDLQFL